MKYNKKSVCIIVIIFLCFIHSSSFSFSLTDYIPQWMKERTWLQLPSKPSWLRLPTRQDAALLYAALKRRLPSWATAWWTKTQPQKSGQVIIQYVDNSRAQQDKQFSQKTSIITRLKQEIQSSSLPLAPLIKESYEYISQKPEFTQDLDKSELYFSALNEVVLDFLKENLIQQTDMINMLIEWHCAGNQEAITQLLKPLASYVLYLEDPTLEALAILELPGDATEEEIKNSYKKLAIKWHPDRNRGNEEMATIKMQKINNAYDLLMGKTTTETTD